MAFVALELRERDALGDQLAHDRLLGLDEAIGVHHQKIKLGAQRQVLLENLALERISRSLEDNRGSKWTVSGLVTEYRGSNYLLVTKAVTQQQEADAAATR